jgi:hypothetical protein
LPAASAPSGKEIVKRPFLIAAVFVCVVLIGIGAWNYFTVSRPFIQATTGNENVRAWVHYQYYLNASVLSFDLRETGTSSMMDVFVVFLQSAKVLQAHKFDKVELQYRGHTRFLIDGAYFTQLGSALTFHDPFYTITGRTSPLNPPTTSSFMSNLYRPDGVKAFPEVRRTLARGSGLIGMLSQMTEEANEFGRELDQFHEFHRQWYLEKTSDSRSQPEMSPLQADSFFSNLTLRTLVAACGAGKQPLKEPNSLLGYPFGFFEFENDGSVLMFLLVHVPEEAAQGGATWTNTHRESTATNVERRKARVDYLMLAKLHSLTEGVSVQQYEGQEALKVIKYVPCLAKLAATQP